VKIPGRELALAKRGGAEHTPIDFMGEIKDLVSGNTMSNVRDNVNVKLTDATAAELARRPIEYDTGFTLLPGKHMIKLLARDDETARIDRSSDGGVFHGYRSGSQCRLHFRLMYRSHCFGGVQILLFWPVVKARVAAPS